MELSIVPFEELEKKLRWRETESPVEEGLEDHPLVRLRLRRDVIGGWNTIPAVQAEPSVFDQLVNLTLLDDGSEPSALRRTLFLLLFRLRRILRVLRLALCVLFFGSGVTTVTMNAAVDLGLLPPDLLLRSL